MPEIAEVTVAAGQLRVVAVGRRIDDVTVTHPRTMRSTSAEALGRLVGGSVDDVTRVGKWIVVHVSGGRTLGIHLRMSGQLLAAEPGLASATGDHRHGRLRLSTRAAEPDPAPGVPTPPPAAPGTGRAATDLWFRDPRTFGELRVFDGPVPTAPDLFDPSVSAPLLVERARRRRVGVKAVLLDQQRFVAGIGSYLADEALHRAGVDPRRPAHDLSRSAWSRVLGSARDVATISAARGGVTLPDEGWVDLWGRPGRYGDELLVHGRERCGTCGTATRRQVVGGRSARWCPRCQPWSRTR